MKIPAHLLSILACLSLHGQWSVTSDDPENDPRGKSVL
jgi:hypothetical protein